MRPSLVPPIVMVCRWARPCIMPTRFSLRVSTQRTGRSSRRAAQAITSGVPVDADLGAEPAAHVGGDDPHRARLQPHRPGHRVPGQLRVLGAGPDGQAAIGPARRGRADLQRHRGQPLVGERALDHDVAAAERIGRGWSPPEPTTLVSVPVNSRVWSAGRRPG